MLKIISFLLAISCQPAPVTPDRVDDKEQASANNCPAGSQPSDQCPPATSNVGGTGGTPNLQANPTNSGPNAQTGTTDGTPPAETTDGNPPTETTGGDECLSAKEHTYRADHLSLAMTVEGHPTGCRIKFVFKPNKPMPRKKYKAMIRSGRGSTLKEEEQTCEFDPQATKQECYYQLVTTFPADSVTSLSPEQDTKWYIDKCPACWVANHPTYTIKYLDIAADDDIKIDYLFDVVKDFELDISIDGKPFVDTNGNKPKITKQ